MLQMPSGHSASVLQVETLKISVRKSDMENICFSTFFFFFFFYICSTEQLCLNVCTNLLNALCLLENGMQQSTLMTPNALIAELWGCL